MKHRIAGCVEKKISYRAIERIADLSQEVSATILCQKYVIMKLIIGTMRTESFVIKWLKWARP